MCIWVCIPIISPSCVVPKIIRVQSPDGMKKIPSTKRETAAAFLKKVFIVLLVH